MHRLFSVMCLLAGFSLAFASPGNAAQPNLQGAWTATKADSDGKAADDVVGHRLVITGNGFQIRSADGKLLYGGSV